MDTSRQRHPLRQFFIFLLPGIYLAAALTIDLITPLGLLTPFFAVMGMLFMALKYRPAVMIAWTDTKVLLTILSEGEMFPPTMK